MAECCGKERDTLFCPDCGRKIAAASTPLLWLLSHCRRIARAKRKSAERNEAWAEKEEGKEARRIYMERYQRTAARHREIGTAWEERADALAALIEANQRAEKKEN